MALASSANSWEVDMAEMWGIAGGARNFIQDQMELDRLALQRQEAQNLERHREAQRVATNTELFQRERKLVMEEDAAEEARALRRDMATPGEGEGMATPAGQIRALRERANRLMQRGYVEDAAKLLNTSAQTLVRLENAAKAESETAQNEFTRIGEQTRRLQEALTGVKSPADFDAAKLALAAMPEMAELLQHPMLQKYDPQLISRFVQNAPAWVKEQELNLRERTLRSANALRQARIEFMGFQRGIQERQTAVAEQREARLAKAGAGGAGGGGSAQQPAAKVPTENARLEVSKFLRGQKLLESDAGARALQISSITEDAQTLVQRNRGIASFAEAVQIAVENAKARGELSEEKSRFGSNWRFKQSAGSVARPINVKPGMQIRLEDNKHYRDEKGNVALYRGGQWIPVYSANARQVVQPPSVNNPLLDEDDEEGEE
jgi:hypothetical protein